MFTGIRAELQEELAQIRSAGLYKAERTISTPQAAQIEAAEAGAPPAQVLHFCANNYLGLADDPRLIDAANDALDTRGFGMASVRFIGGPQHLPLDMERRVSGA